MASSIPVLNGNQMKRFRDLLGQGRKIDLTNKLAAKNQRLPSLQEDEPKEVVAADGQIIITIRNTTNTAFTAGMAVAIDLSQAMAVPNVYPAKKIDASVNNPFGVCLAAIESNATGDCIILGLADVTITGSSGLFSKPNANGVFVRGNEGVRVMGISSVAGKAIVMLGDYYEEPVAPTPTSGYNGAFAVKKNNNGTFTVYNAANASDTNAGTVTIGRTILDIPVSTITTELTVDFKIYFAVYYDSNTHEYGYDFVFSLPNNNNPQYWYKELAVVDAEGALHQTHLCGNIEIAGRWCS